jgi:UDP-N-acetylmuramyl pentapeptide phosphotransferase/UDP-N-acetylglucosamine-1-phosphate transferase
MGGLMILTSLSISMLLWMDLQPLSLGLPSSSPSASGLIGFLDDYDKVTKSSHKGVSGRTRLLAEFVVARSAATSSCAAPAPTSTFPSIAAGRRSRLLLHRLRRVRGRRLRAMP